MTMEIKVTLDLSDRVMGLSQDILAKLASAVAGGMSTAGVAPPARAPKAKKEKAAPKEPTTENPTPTAGIPAGPASEGPPPKPGPAAGTAGAIPKVDIPPSTGAAPTTRNDVIQALTAKATLPGLREPCIALVQARSTNARKDLTGVPSDQLGALKAEIDALAPVV